MGKRILVVDDSRTIRSSVKYTLEKEGYEVILAKDGKDGLAKLEENSSMSERPKMIITDVNMPNMDGITFVQEVKKSSKFKFIPALILTTESQASMKEKGKKAGAAGWLVKPFKPEQLLKVAKKFIR
ncbi:MULTISPECIES: response regulator [unclassified Candidatus Frackibacter]|uniref:response regulator n=1 Tax=unclassified Candidatus Frackibacter TaxID=2648818 RepID=UPI00088CC101|nr:MULTISPECIES: response regulator [unclassified Candidatus Frackibacter]SDC87226.1 two-component system, chemotaxis family, response regulator CheY [Candidatus Frackibacter sp. WG11]SEN01457.1 two-component system, chemotaxis family, response regulator CheY [Candidatus Frackibacter sp. WG12]SFM08947.1 two-component system, chemotaxis family, response regulator CheY [Candidatus Frackibacter sp. WG13]